MPTLTVIVGSTRPGRAGGPIADWFIEQARQHVPVAVINPSHSYLASGLRGEPDSGAGRHWWLRLSAADLKNHQLPDPAGPYAKPAGW